MCQRGTAQCSYSPCKFTAPHADCITARGSYYYTRPGLQSTRVQSSAPQSSSAVTGPTKSLMLQARVGRAHERAVLGYDAAYVFLHSQRGRHARILNQGTVGRGALPHPRMPVQRVHWGLQSSCHGRGYYSLRPESLSLPVGTCIVGT